VGCPPTVWLVYGLEGRWPKVLVEAFKRKNLPAFGQAKDNTVPVGRQE